MHVFKKFTRDGNIHITLLISLRHNKPALNGPHMRPALLAVYFIASRSCLETTVRGWRGWYPATRDS